MPLRIQSRVRECRDVERLCPRWFEFAIYYVRSSTSSFVEALHEPQVGLSLLHQPAQIRGPTRYQALSSLLQQLPRLVEVEPFAETDRLGHGRADVVAHLRVVPGSLLHEPHPAAACQPDQGQRRDQQRRQRRVAPAPAP